MIDSFRGDFSWLSNFWTCSVEYDGLTYSCVENAYQAAKTLDKEERKKFQRCAPRFAKHMGYKVELRKDWESVKLDVMHQILKKKFTKGSDLAELLLLTEDEKLVEGNDWNDTFWGVCDGKGENHLGQLLMRVRDELRE